MVDVEVSCKEAAAALDEKFKYENWFKGTWVGQSADGVDSIFMKYQKRNPESYRLYQYKGYPVLMREVKDHKADKADRCNQGK